MRWLGRWQNADEDISVYIFNSSCQLIGLSLAVIGILTTDPQFRNLNDRPHGLMLSVIILFFLLSTLSSYLALRTRKSSRQYHLEVTSEICFGLGLLLMALICIFMALDVI